MQLRLRRLSPQAEDADLSSRSDSIPADYEIAWDPWDSANIDATGAHSQRQPRFSPGEGDGCFNLLSAGQVRTGQDRSEQVSGHLVGKDLEQIGQAQQLLDAGFQVDQLEFAVGAVDGGNLEGDDGAEAGAIEVLEIGEVEDDAAPAGKDGADQGADVGGVFGDELAVAINGGGELAALVW